MLILIFPMPHAIRYLTHFASTTQKSRGKPYVAGTSAGAAEDQCLKHKVSRPSAPSITFPTFLPAKTPSPHKYSWHNPQFAPSARRQRQT